MKKFLLVITFSVYWISCPAQILNRIKNKVEQKVVDQVDHSIDKALEKKKPRENTKASDSPDSGTQAAETRIDTTKTNTALKNAPASTVNADIKSYSRFDFVPGSKIIVHEDFSQDAVGDFPATWNTRSGAELVTIDGRQGKWLRINQNGVFYPEYLTSDFPENFTLQLDLLASKQVSNIGEFMISLMQTKDTDQKFNWGKDNAPGAPGFNISFQPSSSSNGDLRYFSNLIGSQYKHGVPEFNMEKNAVKISIWKQKQRVRVYLDSTKVLDLPRALDVAAALNTLTFACENPDFDQKGGAFFIGNIQLAIGAADTRNKLITEGKFTTHGILFDVNRDQILPQSYGALQEISRIMQENASLRVQIVGHTDADGNEGTNLDLSRRRADAVKEAMISNFNIDGTRLEIDGKGKTQPIDSNETPVGKANNRRVEFVKL